MTEHPDRQPRTRGRPPAADQGQVTATALGLLDEVGLDALTMRKLAVAVGVQVGTLYSYFPTKQALLTSMAEAMLESCASAVGDARPAHEQVLALARSLREALLARRDGARVYAGTHAVGPNTLGLADALIGALQQGGLAPAAATRTALLLIHFTTGHALEEEAAIRPESSDEVAGLRVAIRQGDYPNLTETHEYLIGADYAQLFEDGLRLLTADLGVSRGTAPRAQR